MDREQAAALGDIILIKDAWCPKHGRGRPDLGRFPMTWDAEALRVLPQWCGGTGCEEEMLFDAEATDTKGREHYFLLGDDRGIRLAKLVKPINLGDQKIWAEGVKPNSGSLPKSLEPYTGIITEAMTDRPSGAADWPPSI